MKNIKQPDVITEAACRWLLSGGVPGAYAGPDPGMTHDLSPLLAREMGRKDISLFTAAAWFRQEQIVRPVLERISGEGTKVWAVKGFDLARSVYPFPGGRTMCDADLFMEERNRHKILSMFCQSGWSRGSPGDGIFNAGIVSEMKMYRHGAMVELHTHIFYFPATFPGRLPTDLFENDRLLEPGLMGFAWHNALLIVLLHMMTNTMIRPVWWVDICLLCRKVSEAGTWNKFARNAFETQLGNSLAYLLRTASAKLEAPVPE
ncbi:MAG: nucleotidyltransferase family protein, partial [Candidatus Aegiribacteria sp.]|nr:nucleotidyltransferase family protein [Candidatus Aegiribacteria sp.]